MLNVHVFKRENNSVQEQPEVHEGEALAVFTYGDKVDEGAIVQEGGV